MIEIWDNDNEVFTLLSLGIVKPAQFCKQEVDQFLQPHARSVQSLKGQKLIRKYRFRMKVKQDVYQNVNKMMSERK